MTRDPITFDDVHKALKDLLPGATVLIVGYEGSGDDGSLVEAAVFAIDDTSRLDRLASEPYFDPDDIAAGSPYIPLMGDTNLFYDIKIKGRDLEDFVDDILPDYYNGTGGSGMLVIDFLRQFYNDNFFYYESHAVDAPNTAPFGPQDTPGTVTEISAGTGNTFSQIFGVSHVVTPPVEEKPEPGQRSIKFDLLNDFVTLNKDA